MNRLEISAKACTFLLLLNILTTSTIAESECLCQFNDENCTRLVENDTIFYSTADVYDIYFCPSISYSKAARSVKSSGIIKCWKSNFKPQIIEIEKCEHGRIFHDAVPYNSPGSCEKYLGIFDRDYQSDISKISVCLVKNGTNIRWLGKYEKSDILNSVEVILNFPEELRVISVHDVPMNFDVPYNLTVVEFLSLSNVQLQQIPSNFLKSAGKLRTVSFNHNSIKEIRAESFVNQNNLKLLQLNHNAIEILGICTLNETNNFLVYLTRLQTLYLTHNRISRICPNFFQYSSHLYVIDLSYNKIVTLNGVFVSEFKSLEQNINLSHNLLEYISDKDFLFFSRLERLDLSHNRIRFIDKFAFFSGQWRFPYILDASNNFLNSIEFLLPSNKPLWIVSLNNNNLKSIPEFSEFETTPFSLDMAGNHISYIDLTKLSLLMNSTNFKRLNLENNNIKIVDFQVPNIPVLVDFSVSLNNNPLTCDCSVKQLRKFITSGIMLDDRIKFVTDRLYCHQPQSLRNVLLADVDEWFLQCADEEYRCPLNCSCRFLPTGTMVNCNYVGAITESDVMELKQLKNVTTLL